MITPTRETKGTIPALTGKPEKSHIHNNVTGDYPRTHRETSSLQRSALYQQYTIHVHNLLADRGARQRKIIDTP